ncbi:MAG: TIGR03560 family F420-dependent LLM class oxidoreductase [Anaerolineae bacterium]|nr:MAG: TIGR03560 family F420-dependent LLM class oxidoreductase [Anaerolineae bacterium]
MKIGLQLPHFRPSTPPTMRTWLRDTAQAAEAAGFDGLWVMDHFFQLNGWLGAPETDMLEGYTTLGYLAGVTQKPTLGLMVGGAIYRHPAQVVKIISTLDVLSGGRAIFGIGAAWNEEECKGLGMRFPPLKERFELLEEQLIIAKHMFSGNAGPLKTKHWNLEYPHNNPQPVQKPHPPILIGGMGKVKTMRLIAKYANACNFFGGRGEEQVRERLEDLKRACEKEGRDYATIEKTLLQTIDREGAHDPDPIVRAQEARSWGFDYVIFNIRGLYDPATMKYLTDDVVPAVKAL